MVITLNCCQVKLSELIFTKFSKAQSQMGGDGDRKHVILSDKKDELALKISI